MSEVISSGSVRDVETVVIGGGLSGLEVARQLQRDGVVPVLLEATERLGGVIKTLESEKLGVHEAGAEFIDREHTHLIDLCQTLEVDLASIYGGGKDDYAVLYHSAGATRGAAEFGAAIEQVIPSLMQDQAILAKSDGMPILQQRVAWLKRASVEQYLDDLKSKISSTSHWAVEMIKLIHEAEYAGSAKALSAVEFLASGYEEISCEHPSPYQYGYGEYVVRNGSERIIDGLKRALDHSDLRVSSVVECVTEISDGRYEVDIGSTALIAEKVVLAAPTPALRSIDLSNAPITNSQRDAIRSLGWGVSSKTIVGYDCDPTIGVEFRNETYSEELKGCIWKATQYRAAGSPGKWSLVILRGGDDARASINASAHATVEVLETIFPGSKKSFNEGFDVILYDQNTPYVGGSWMAPLPGQDALKKAFAKPAKNIIFAGSGVDSEYYGYMEGAIRAARRAYRLLQNR